MYVRSTDLPTTTKLLDTCRIYVRFKGRLNVHFDKYTPHKGVTTRNNRNTSN